MLKNFLRGFGSVIDLFPIKAGREFPSVEEIKIPTVEEAYRRDFEAIKGDWERVGMDIWNAAQKINRNV